MQISGKTVIEAPPETVWARLIDPDFLRTLIPGCESMTGNVAEGYDITVERQVSGIKARMTGHFDLTEVEPARAALLTGHGQAGGVGQATGTCRITLTPKGAGTRLNWAIDAAIEGRLASMPEWVVGLAARRVANGFVQRFAAAVDQREPAQKQGWLGRLTGG